MNWRKLAWWHHQMETFSVLLVICAWNSLVTGEFPTQRPVTWSFNVFFDLRLNKRLSKQWWGWRFEMPSRPLLRHCNGWFLYPPKRSLGGYTGFTQFVRPSVRPSVRPWVGVRMITLILFSGFKKFFLHISLGSRSCMGLNISVLPH